MWANVHSCDRNVSTCLPLRPPSINPRHSTGTKENLAAAQWSKLISVICLFFLPLSLLTRPGNINKFSMEPQQPTNFKSTLLTQEERANFYPLSLDLKQPERRSWDAFPLQFFDLLSHGNQQWRTNGCRQGDPSFHSTGLPLWGSSWGQSGRAGKPRPQGAPQRGDTRQARAPFPSGFVRLTANAL